MIDTIASVVEWVRDQVREIRHVAPTSVLKPADRITCQWELDDHDAHCRSAAVWRLVVHDCLGERRVWTLCEWHHDCLMERWHVWLGLGCGSCSRCGVKFLRMADVFPMVGRL